MVDAPRSRAAGGRDPARVGDRQQLALVEAGRWVAAGVVRAGCEGDELVQFVNKSYGTSLPRVDMSTYLFNGNTSSGGYPKSSYGPPTQAEVIEFAAAYFSPETLDAF